MRERKKSKSSSAGDEKSQILARLEDLELRMKLLEARVRNSAQSARRVSPAEARAIKSREARRSRQRARCPGCTLELPPGKKGESCVWCGFQFDAVGGKLR
jgi:hypothetical protein